ncbi:MULTISPECIES: GDSL-type esterase/lipase family protein [unclassified Nostoc]|uniref:GDSL-type esterase/lipase family protein n=1 Tax=unclassified Nostoc TaxID=2593658 RepID=UPI002AD38566|nr:MULTISPECIES: GDSL-type esterase/lipase family protein [unclassified Nostoc]MDZ8120933.1 GDSL-type esterase/lipase family protein [Nostoc sp. CmiVER01]MDZ8223653.1 GDSL-type esterase/lipase family protein [Nostoc sp. ChiVER01]
MELQHLPEVRICFVGDSFVNGTGDQECLGWTGRVCANANKKGYDITYYNLGIRRDTSTDISKRWLQEVSLRLPKEYDGRVVFSFGLNDTTLENGKTRVDLTDSIKNACEILSKAQKLYPVLMVGPAPYAEQKDSQRTNRNTDLSKQFALICNKLNIPYLDVLTILEKSNIWINEARANDGVHPRAGGYTEFAQIVENWDAWLNWFLLT